ncbi:MAG: urea ABC transporter permease subunit UrtC, partial [Cellvibrio sp.]
GAFTVNYGKTLFTSYSPETWLFVLGALFVIVTLLLPKGLVGLFIRPKKSESAHEALDNENLAITTDAEKITEGK